MNDPFETPESDALRREGAAEHLDLEQRLSQAEDVKPEAMPDAPVSPDNFDLPAEAQPATAYTERGAASRVETGPEKVEVKNFDAETGVPKPPEGWHPGGPERGG